jgi:hypothetical protein
LLRNAKKGKRGQNPSEELAVYSSFYTKKIYQKIKSAKITCFKIFNGENSNKNLRKIGKFPHMFQIGSQIHSS